MSLLDFQYALKPEAKEQFADVFNIVKNSKGENVDLRKMVWLTPEFKVFSEENESGIEKIKSKFEVKKGQKKVKGIPKTIFILERSDYWPNSEDGPMNCGAEFDTIDGALAEFYSDKDLIELLIKNDALHDGRYFWKYTEGEWQKSWFLETL